MPLEQPQEEHSINEEAEAMARANRELLFRSRIPFGSARVIFLQLAEPMGRALGLDPSKVPADLANTLQTLREQISGRKPPPLEESREPATGLGRPEE